MSHIIYQVFCGRWEQANVLQHPGEVLNQLASFDWKSLLEQYHFTHVYLLGLWDTSGPIIVNEEEGKDITQYPNRCPSPFAITNHTIVNPLLGTVRDLSQLIAVLHELGIQVLVDFVPNHTGLAHPWVKLHPEYYKDTDLKPVFSGDVAELNYSNQTLRSEMRLILKAIAQLRVDGVRCDMAHLIPTSFWSTSILYIRSIFPRFRFIAEAYAPNVFDLSSLYSLMDAGFDAVYDEPLYRNLVSYSKGSSADHVWGHMHFVTTNRPEQWVHYLSNHDDSCPFTSSDVQLWLDRLLQLPGWNLVYNGLLNGQTHRLAHHYVELLHG